MKRRIKFNYDKGCPKLKDFHNVDVTVNDVMMGGVRHTLDHIIRGHYEYGTGLLDIEIEHCEQRIVTRHNNDAQYIELSVRIKISDPMLPVGEGEEEAHCH